jgi:hypothetical protein
MDLPVFLKKTPMFTEKKLKNVYPLLFIKSHILQGKTPTTINEESFNVAKHVITVDLLLSSLEETVIENTIYTNQIDIVTPFFLSENERDEVQDEVRNHHTKCMVGPLMKANYPQIFNEEQCFEESLSRLSCSDGRPVIKPELFETVLFKIYEVDSDNSVIVFDDVMCEQTVLALLHEEGYITKNTDLHWEMYGLKQVRYIPTTIDFDTDPDLFEL